MADFSIAWAPPGPVAAGFIKSTARVKMIMGPWGSGKTSTCLMEPVYAAMNMPVSPIDGIRHYKHSIVRDTYRNLTATTIPSWHEWVPKELGQWNGEPPMSHQIPFDPGDGKGLVDLEVEFIALGEHRVEDVMRGWQGSSAYINEADRLPRDVLTYLKGRVGRFPGTRHGDDGDRRFVSLDMNAPDTENWTYEDFVDTDDPDLADYEFYRQPSGLSPLAENIKNLPKGYYDELAVGQPKWWVRRMILNQFGYSREGLPVYEEWNEEIHVAANELMPVRGLILVIGFDAGLTPAATICQQMPNGQWRILDEICTLGFGPTRFSELVNQMLATEKYRGMEAVGYADPSAAYGEDKEAGEESWIDTVANKTGIRILPAPSNQISLRQEAVRLPLTRLIDGHIPGLLLSPTCKVLRKGFNSGYRYKRQQLIGQDRYSDTPEKNEFSHVHDALQYPLLGAGDQNDLRGRKTKSQGAARQIRAIDDENSGVWTPGLVVPGRGPRARFVARRQQFANED